MSPLPAPSIGTLEARVAEIRKAQKKTPRPIGFHVSAPWTGPAVLRLDGDELPVWYCPSVLAFRARLAASEGAAVPPVLLTDRLDSDLGQDVLARLDKRKLHRLDAWAALQDRFGVRDVDRRLQEKELRWMPEHLLSIPPSEIQRPASGFLDLDEAWRLLLARLGFSTPSPDVRDLLEWTTRPEGLARLALLPPEAREGHARRLASEGAAEAVVKLILAGRGREAVAAGLVCEVLFPRPFSKGVGGAPSPPGPGGEGPGEGGWDQIAKAAGRFEAALLGKASLAPAAGREWAEEAAAIVRRRLEKSGLAGVSAWFREAEELLAELNIQGLGRRSSWLPAGFDRAVEVFAGKLSDWLDKRDAARLAEVSAAGRAVTGHGLSRVRETRFETEAGAVKDLLRLVRWLKELKERKETAPSFAKAAAGYMEEGSWVDRLRSSLADAPLPGALGETRDRLLRTVLEAREAENRRFAELLAAWSEIGAAAGPMVPVESVLDRVAAPLAETVPVLVLVLDGMSFAVYRELADDLGKHGWEEHRPPDEPAGLFGVGLLPTVTQVCRASLLAGERKTGDARAESLDFAEHPGLRRRSTLPLPPVLFHKSDLAGDGEGLNPDVRKQVSDKNRRVVGVVLNVVDDQLPKGSQLVKRWSVRGIRYLDELLHAAADADRVVVLTADHGHVVERRTELRRADGAGARYRPTGGAAPEAGEVAVRGPRVLLNEGSGLILAWSEGHRYTAKQGGYHGGASPQEVLVPLAVWRALGSDLPGWKPAEQRSPAWWDALAEAAPALRPILSETAPKPPDVVPKIEPSTAPAAGPRASKLQPTLFDAPSPPPAAASWLDDLFVSPVYLDQKRRASRQALPDEEVRAVLEALAARGGRLPLSALARQRGTSAMRTQQLVAALQRLLNVEGYAVVSFESESETVSLDEGLLRTQFPRGES